MANKPDEERVSDAQIIEAIIDCHGLVTAAADRLGIATNTIYIRGKACKEIGNAIKEARLRLADMAEDKLIRAVDNGEQWAIVKLLDNYGRDRGYGKGGGDDGEVEPVAVIKILPPSKPRPDE